MILKTVQVKNFKCIKDSTAFTIDERVTCLVGKNESGKTTLLQAISKLNAIDTEAGAFSILDYPRRQLREYQDRAEREPAEALVTTWALSPQDVEGLEQLIGPAAGKAGIVTFRKNYSNETGCSIDVDEAAVVDNLIASHQLTKDEIRSVQGASSLAALHTKLSELETRTERQHALLVSVVTRFQEDSVPRTVGRWLQGRLPKFAYFSEYLRMPAQISVTALKRRLRRDKLEDGDRVFLALLDMIGRSVDDLENVDQHEMLTAELEGGSNRLTEEIFKYWTQNRRLRVQFLLQRALPGDPAPFNTGWIIRTRIQNTRYGDTINFDDRSAGFIWFFSFVIWFNQIRNNLGEKLIILLDDPGLSLHANAQRDLLRYIEERLAPEYQVVYSTHSPFMIDPTRLSRVRTVENIFIEAREGEPGAVDLDLGTRVGDEVLSSNRDTLFPLQAALAYEIAQPLLAAEHSVIVDGPAEVLYFQWFKRKLAALGRATLDNRWIVTPSGGIEKVAAFLTLFSGGRPHIAVVTGYTASRGSSVSYIRNSALLKQGHVLTMDLYADTEDAGIEDIIGRPAYVELVRQAFNLTPEIVRPIARPVKPALPMVKEVEDLLKALSPGIGEFDRYRPAEFLIQQGADFTLPELGKALNRFESLFADLNSILN